MRTRFRNQIPSCLAFVVGIFIFLVAPTSVAKPYVVELAVFTCPHCYNVDQYVKGIETQYGSHFIFAPLPFEGGQNLAMRSYYALRHKTDQDNLRQGLFALMQTMRFKPENIAEVVQFLRVRGIQFDSDRVEKQAFGERVSTAEERAVNLAKKAGITSVPAFVVVSDKGNIVKSFEREPKEDPSAFVDRVLRNIH